MLIVCLQNTPMRLSLLNQPGRDMNKELLKIDGIKKHKSKIHTIDIDYTESPDYSDSIRKD